MSTTHSAPPSRAAVVSCRRQIIAEVGLIFLIFFIQGAWPVPGVNETHYLTKAKHYWNPSWCPGDMFLGSRDAHQVFSWTCGWLTCLLSLPATAWCGRIATWGLLAWAWQRFSSALVPRRLFAVLSAALLVAGTTRLHLAGEWLIGGFEAKGLAYVFVLFALAALARGQWRAVWPLLGVASAFHVLVGGWSVSAAGLAWVAAGRDRPKLGETAWSLAVGLLLALPGLISAIMLNWGVDADVVDEANRIYVFQRLPHHLVPQAFAPLFAFRHLFLVGIWLILCVTVPTDAGDRRIRWFVAATISISLVGCLIAWLTLGHDVEAATLLRYYWFRMADILVPLGVAIEVTRLLAQLERSRPERAQWALLAAIFVGAFHLGAVVIERQHELRPQADNRINNLAAWREVCEWVSANTPPDAVFLTPRDAQSFHWYAGRSEVVSYKDIPQDATDIVEWWRRVGDLYRQPLVGGDFEGYATLAELGRSRLEMLARKYHASYMIAGLDPPLALQRVGPTNQSFVIYKFPDGSAESIPAAGAITP
jgi:hypothetical protein